MGIWLERHQTTDYTYNYKEGDRIVKTYYWNGVKGKLIDKKELTEEAFNALMQTSNAVQDGELRIVEDEAGKEAIEYISDVEDYKNNARTRDEIVKLLNGNVNALKKELAKVTNKNELLFFADVCKQEQIDSVSKQKAIADAIGSTVEAVFNSVLEEN